VLVVMLISLVCLPTVIYRFSGGNVKLWFKLQVSHSNPTIKPFYMSQEGRSRLKARIEADRKALGRIIASYPNPVLGFLHMFLDRKTYAMTRLNNADGDGAADPHNPHVVQTNLGADVNTEEVASTRRTMRQAAPMTTLVCPQPAVVPAYSRAAPGAGAGLQQAAPLMAACSVDTGEGL